MTTNSSSERSFSAMRRIKTYLRTTMKQLINYICWTEPMTLLAIVTEGSKFLVLLFSFHYILYYLDCIEKQNVEK